MAAREKTSFLLDNEGMNMEFYLNAHDEIFVSTEDDGMAGAFWFTISKEDWKDLKEFIDRQFQE